MKNQMKHKDPKIQRAIKDMLSRIDLIRLERADPFINLILDRFVSGVRQFSPGVFLIQDPKNIEHRLSDLLGGWPYVNDSNPWPLTRDANFPMQPIVQLRLSTVGNLFSVPAIGDGLLQVWGPAFRNFDDVLSDLNNVFLLRIIPSEELSAPASNICPDDLFWDGSHFRPRDKNVEFLMNPSDSCDFSEKSLAVWQCVRPMFGVFCHLYNYLDLDEQDQMGGSDEYWPIAEEIADKTSSSVLSMAQHTVYLGGLGGAAGGSEDPSFGKDLLLTLADGNGFHFAITLNVNKDNQLEYTPVFRIRS